ncbi:hypothetical protein Tco_1498475 [Tanacetum coccineum]
MGWVASREGDRGDLDFRSLLYGGRSLSYQECFEEAREDELDREAMLIPLLIDRIPIICSLSGEGDKGEGPNMFYPQPPSVISNLNSLFLFTSTMSATTSNPLLVREKASAQGLMKSQQLVRTRFWLVIPFKKGIAKYAKVSSTHQKCLDLDNSSYFFQKSILL